MPLKGDVILVAQQINTLNAPFLNTLAILTYASLEEPRVDIPVPSPVFKQVQPIWLYDEFDLVEPGVFSHEILVSDGRVIKLLFRDFNYHIVPLCLPSGSATVPAPPKERMASA